MQISHFEVSGLFRRFNHHLDFPTLAEGDPRRSLLILHGANGVGKTTMLRMLNSLLGEANDSRYRVFRSVPFDSCTLTVSGVEPLSVEKTDEEISIRLGTRVEVLPAEPPPDPPYSLGVPYRLRVAPKGPTRVSALHTEFRRAARELSFEFIQTARIDLSSHQNENSARELTLFGGQAEPTIPSLSERMQKFIASAQLNYESFFSTNEPDLFEQIIKRLTGRQHRLPIAMEDLLKRIQSIHSQDIENARYGLQRDRWNNSTLQDRVNALPKTGSTRASGLIVLDQYLNVLESRVRERALVAQRLTTFEEVMSEFYAGKRVKVSADKGLIIETDEGEPLTEDELSSGERHLLYLMVSATVTRRIGTVIAIDEPEMSIHIAWQRKLIPALLRCAANAAPQFIFATHSPQIAAEYPDALQELHSL